MNTLSFITHSESETFGVAASFAKRLKGYVGPICINGNLGAGKTIFCKGVISTLSNVDHTQIQSPTFNYLNIYQANPEIYHFDLYRLNNTTDFQKLGFDDYINNSYLSLIEWPERIHSILPKNSIVINIQSLNETSRLIDVTGAA